APGARCRRAARRHRHAGRPQSGRARARRRGPARRGTSGNRRAAPATGARAARTGAARRRGRRDARVEPAARVAAPGGAEAIRRIGRFDRGRVRAVTLDQAFAFAIVAAMMALFVWGRLRYDLVALLALLAAVAVGIVPPDKAFSGFSDDILVIVASALLVSAAVSRSGIVDAVLRRVSPHLRSPTTQVLGLVTAVTLPP